MNFVWFFLLAILLNIAFADENVQVQTVYVEVINKVTTEKNKIQLKIGKSTIFENILINANKCIVDVDNDVSYVLIDVLSISGTQTLIFSGWLSSDSISLNSIENNIYDVNIVSNCY